MRKGLRVAPREPTEAMLDAAREWSRKKYGTPVGNDGATGCWQAMLDAATHDKCKADKSGEGGNDPQDCDWPGCGCDPYASEVIAAIEESGFKIAKADS